MASTIIWEGVVAYRRFRLVDMDGNPVLEQCSDTDAMGVDRWLSPGSMDPTIVAALLTAVRS
jgi:hypothetical protein